MKELYDELEQVQKILEIPQLFVSDYFFELRNQMDQFYLKKRIEGNEEDDIWMKIIARIETFEKELTRSNRKILTDSIIKKTNEQIKFIRSKIESFVNDQNKQTNKSKQEGEDHNQNEKKKEEYEGTIEQNETIEISNIKELITLEKRNLKKILFLNKTITCFDQNKLVIINNYFLTDQDLKEIREKSFNPPISNGLLENEYIKLKKLAYFSHKKLNTSERIVEINLDWNKSVETVNVQNNGHLTSLDNNSFKDFVNLHTLNLSYNQISSIETNTFRDLVNLNELWLNGNQITSINNLFQGLVNLKWLDLSKNKLETIDQNAFTDLTSLFTLNLSKNKIVSINIELFKNLIDLSDLWLQDNQITKLVNSEFLKDLINLKWLDLSLNPLDEQEKTKLKINLTNLDVLNLENATEKRKRDRLKEILKYDLFSNKASVNTSCNKTDKNKVLMRNLLRNPCGEDDFNFWLSSRNHYQFDHEINFRKNGIDSNRIKELIKLHKNSNGIENESKWMHEGWEIETEQNGAPKNLFKADCLSLYENFSTTHFSGQKSQLIDLAGFGIDEAFMKHVKPSIEVGENYTARFDCGCQYHLRVYLIDSKFELIDNLSFDDTLLQWYDGEWRQLTHKFTYGSNYDTLRYILFSHGGRDTQYWAGFYGSKMSNGFVRFVE